MNGSGSHLFRTPHVGWNSSWKQFILKLSYEWAYIICHMLLRCNERLVKDVVTMYLSN
jgi:hypothetical protein